ncbi:MAG: hypothetical protein ACXWAC_02205 [Usitatibacter sp.]
MDDPTLEFNLITFHDVQSASFSGARISRPSLRDRIVFARTNLGNFAKFQVKAGDDLLITRLTVYNSAGCIVRTASNLTIRSSLGCDLDNARESSTGADFWWHGVSVGVNYLEAQNSASFHLFKGFDDVTFDDMRSAPFSNRRVDRQFLHDQVLYCRTSQGRFAKLLVESGDTLIVRRLVVFRPDGSVHLDRSNIAVPQTYTLDVDTASVAAAGYDLWWEAATATSFFLVPTNGAAISHASFYSFEKYLPLLASAAIRSAAVFVDDAGTRHYADWSDGEKLLLNEFLYLRETGAELPIAGPPALTGGRYMSGCDAWKIYLAHVSQSLWVDTNARVAWSLAAASAEHLAHLFDARTLLAFSPGSGHSFEFFTMGAVTHWSPSISYAFLVDSGLVRGSPWDTIQALADWVRANLVHITDYAYDTVGGPFASQADQWQYIYGYPGLPLVDKMIHPLPGRRHTTQGCWGTDGFLAAVLRAVNVPVRHGRTNFSGLSHSRPEFFTVARSLAHGDDPYNGWVRLGHNNVPIQRLFLDDAMLASLIDAPPARPGMTAPETASYNSGRFMAALAVEFKTDYLLHMRCWDRTAHASGAASDVWYNLHDYYTDPQLETISADCDTAIAAIAGGCASIP